MHFHIHKNIIWKFGQANDDKKIMTGRFVFRDATPPLKNPLTSSKVGPFIGGLARSRPLWWVELN